MAKDPNTNFSFDTELTKRGAYIPKRHNSPEALPIYLTTAFNVDDLDDLLDRYSVKGYCYNRISNPNRDCLSDLMSYLENGEASISCSSGMAAITTALLTSLKPGEHILADMTLYGETFDLFERVFARYNVDYTCIDMTDLGKVRANIRPNTKVLFAETASNPMITVVDLKTLADIAHENGARFIADNTFMTPYVIRPLELGADLVVNSLTKFANGHFDTVCGSITGPKDLIERCHLYQKVLGSQADGFVSWLTMRGMRTMSLRVERQMQNAELLAKALSENPHVAYAHHPSLSGHPQHELAKRQFGGKYGGMLSFCVKNEDTKLINAFMRKLQFVHYAMTLGGYRTTIAHPVSSSHRSVPEEKRFEMGITNGLIRVSCGIEEGKDVVADFTQALEVFK